jgi:hypothetical protein
MRMNIADALYVNNCEDVMCVSIQQACDIMMSGAK